jgi:serine phosphatase RsbU (regulator of sigma subunit)
VAARYEAGSDGLEVGGDWYDSFGLPGGRIGLAVGDVVGTGLEAAAAMGRIRTALVALATQADGPAALIAQLDDFVSGPNGSEFATACFATLDPATGELRYASAAHPPPLLVHPDGETRWLDGGRSLPLGGGRRPNRTETSIHVEPGSLLVFYSDGLVERRGESLSGLCR